MKWFERHNKKETELDVDVYLKKAQGQRHKNPSQKYMLPANKLSHAKPGHAVCNDDC